MFLTYFNLQARWILSWPDPRTILKNARYYSFLNPKKRIFIQLLIYFLWSLKGIWVPFINQDIQRQDLKKNTFFSLDLLCVICIDSKKRRGGNGPQNIEREKKSV